MTTSPETVGDGLASAAPVDLETGPGHVRSDWEAAAAAVLRKSGRLGAEDPDARAWELLTRRTLDGIEVSPLGTPDLLEGLATDGRPDRARAWDVRGHFPGADPAALRGQVLADLENGVTSVWLPVGPGGPEVEDLAGALDGVLLEAAPVVLEPTRTDRMLPAARVLAGLAAGGTLADGSGFGADPLGLALRGEDELPEDLAGLLGALAGEAEGVGARAVVVDATAAHDLGASDVQEIGWALAAGAEYLRAFEAAGIAPERAAGLIEFRFAATDEQFPTIAKLRAARRLWSRVLELSGVAAEQRGQLQHAVTSRPMMSRFDPWVNMLRTCVAAFAAGVGGADAVTVHPFDATLGIPDAFGRRIARNTSALLISEAHLARVADPAGGAYAVERLTDDLARAGWAELGRLESVGGAAAAIGEGSFRGRVEEVVAARDAAIATRKRPLTGLSEFPDLNETLPQRAPYPEGTRQVARYGHAFEALRERPAGVPVFLATMGTVAAHTARATFVSNLLAAGGIGVVNPGRCDDVAAVLAAYRGPDGGQQVVCLAGADSAYAEWGAPLVAELRAAGARHVILAGRPVEGVPVDDSCAMGLDALDFLNRTRAILESEEQA